MERSEKVDRILCLISARQILIPINEMSQTTLTRNSFRKNIKTLRFSMKTLKNFGLGKTSLEDSIHFEVTEMIEKVFR